MASIGTVSLELKALTSKFKKDIRSATKRLEDLESELTGIGAATGVAAGALGFLGFKMVKLASDSEETRSLLNVTFGKKGSAQIQKWASDFGTAVGRSTADLERMSGSLGAILQPMVDSNDQVNEMSRSMSQLAVDLGSFFNAADDEALLALRSGLLGESEPLKRFAVNLTEAALKEQLLAEGSKKTVKELSIQEKVMLRYRAILAQTQLAQGDALRTAGGFANQLKGLGADVENLSRSFGQLLLPVAQKFIGVARGISQTLRSLSADQKAMIVNLGLLAGSVSAATAALVAFALVIPKIKAGFLAVRAASLPLMITMFSLAAAVAATVAIVGLMREVWDRNLGGIQEKVGALKDSLDFSIVFKEMFKAFKSVVDGIIERMTYTIGVISSLINQGLSGIFEKGIGDSISQAMDEASKIVDEMKKEGEGSATEGLFSGGAQTAGRILRKGAKTLEQAAMKGGAEFRKVFDVILAKIGALTGGGAPKAPEAKPQEVTVKPGPGVVKGVSAQFDVTSLRQRSQLIGDNLRNLAEGLRIGQETIVGAFESGAPKIAAAINAAKEGFKSGGPWGAVIAVLVDLLTQTEAFNRMMDRANERFSKLIEQLEPLMDAIDRLDNALGFVSEIVEAIVGTISRGIGGAIDWFADRLGIASVAVDEAKESLRAMASELRGEIMSELETAFSNLSGADLLKLAQVGGLDAASQKALEDEIKSRFTEATDAVAKATLLATSTGNPWAALGVAGVANEFGLSELGTAMDILGLSLEDLKETTDAVTGSLTNVPAGFKIALARLAATSPDQVTVPRNKDGTPLVSGAPPAMPPPEGNAGNGNSESGGSTTNIEVVNVTSDLSGIEELVAEIKEIVSFEGTVADGPKTPAASGGTRKTYRGSPVSYGSYDAMGR